MPRRRRRDNDALDSALEALFDGTVVAAWAAPRLVDGELYPQERRYLGAAVDRRRAEFGTARLCARRALARLGVEPCPLLPASDGVPRWPAGIVGSISHTDGCCAVVVAPSTGLLALGLDVEGAAPLPPELEPLVCTPRERRWLTVYSGEVRGLLGKVLFSAKEAFYKCQYALTGTFLEFTDVELAFDPSTRRFRLASASRRGLDQAALRRIEGRYRLAGRYVIAGAQLRSAPPGSGQLS